MSKLTSVYPAWLSTWTIIILASSVASAQEDFLDADKFVQELLNLANNGLGVQEMQNHFDTLTFEPSPVEGRTLVEELKTALNQKFLVRVDALRKIKDAVVEMYDQDQGSFQQCCQVDLSDLEFNSRYGKALDPNTVCTRISPNAEPNSRHFSHEVIEVMKENFRKVPTLKWQYFNSEEGVFTIYPANKLDSCTDGYDGRFRPWYVEAVSPEPKNLVVVIDKSASMKEKYGGKTLMQIAIDAALTVLDTLNPSDRIGVVTFSSEANTLRSWSRETDYLDCFSEELAQATLANVEFLKDFISSLRPSGDTQYGKALREAFSLLRSSYTEEDQQREQVILFLSDGEPTDSKRDIMREVKSSNEQMENKVVILTIAFGTNSGISFLADLAKQDFEKYNIELANNTIGDIQEGQYTHVADYTRLRNTMARYYDFFANTEKLGDEPIFSVPYQDAFGLGLMTTAAIPVKYNGVLKGAVGTDFTLDDLLGEVTYFRQGQKSYSFIYEVNTHAEGRAIMHPLLPAPATIADEPVYVHITSFEREEEFYDIVFNNSTNDQESGEVTFVSSRSLPRGNSANEGVYTTSIESTYYWRHISGSPYVVCLVEPVNDHQNILRQQRPSGEDFLYHRVDIVAPPSSCRHANRHATKAQSVVKFSPNAFLEPVEYLELEEDESVIQQYTDYMNDVTWSVRNNFFKADIKDMVTVTAKVNEIWSRNQSRCEDYTLYRYIGTTNGVFRCYPGVRMNDLYDATVRPWFERSKSNKGVLTLSAPYEDANGAGYIITLSKTIVESVNIFESTSDDVIAVMGIDFTLAYFYHLLTRNYPICKENRYRCFVMDNSGYLVVHKDFFEVNKPDVSALHITEKEPHIAQDLIKEGILSKSACKDFQLIRDYHYYTVETSSRQQSLNKLNDPDPCIRYQLTYIQGSNAYLGIVDTLNRCYSSFTCPCYYELCQETEDDDCECPCLSITRYDYCNDKYIFISDDDPACTPASPSLSPVIEELDAYEGLDQCCKIDCTNLLASSDCIKFVSCSWEEDTGRCIVPFKTTDDSDPAGSSSNLVLIIGLVVGGCVVLLVVAIVVWKVYTSRAKAGLPKRAQNSSQVRFPDETTTESSQATAPPRDDYATTYEPPGLTYQQLGEIYQQPAQVELGEYDNRGFVATDPQ
ncbi:VWFA and cache domain-containing protein 1-like [Glandiceps talaboti]